MRLKRRGMTSLPFIDLAAQQRRLRPALDAAIARVLDHGAYVMGPEVRAFEAASGRPIPYQIAPRRPGDIASCFARVDFAASELGWRATLGLKDMCESTWRFQQRAARG